MPEKPKPEEHSGPDIDENFGSSVKWIDLYNN